MVLPGPHDRRVLWNNSDVLSNFSLHYWYFWLTQNISQWLRVILVKRLDFVSKLRGKMWSQKLQVVRMRGCYANDLQNIICCHSFQIFITIFIVIVCIMYKYHLYMCVCVWVCVCNYEVVNWLPKSHDLCLPVWTLYHDGGASTMCVTVCVCVC